MNDQIKQNILDKIKQDEVKMTSKQFFFMKWFTLLVTSLFFLGVAVYIFAYVVFLFIDNGLMYIPLSTLSGLTSFVIEIPWTLVVLGLLAIVLFSITSKTFYKIYKRPFIAFFMSILILIMLSHILFVESGAMKYLKEEAYNEHIQLVPSKFLQFRSSQTGNLFVGYVISTTTNSIIIRDRQGNILEIIPDDSYSTFNSNDFFIGTQINAYGQRQNEKVFVKSIGIVE